MRSNAIAERWIATARRELLDKPHPGIKQCGDDLAESVVPGVGQSVGEDDLGRDVGAWFVEDHGLGVLEVWIAQRAPIRSSVPP